MATTVIYDPDFGDKLVLGIADTSRENLIDLSRQFCNIYKMHWVDITVSIKGVAEDFFGILPDEVEALVASEGGILMGESVSENMLIHEILIKMGILYTKFLLRHGVELITDFEDVSLYHSDETKLKEK